MSQNPLFRVVFALLLAFAAPLAGQTRPPSTETAPRPLEVGDLFQLRDVRDPRVSPEGDWVAFAVRSLDAEADRADTDLYMVPFAGGESVRLTAGDQPESSPRFSPDGRWIAFLSAREGDHAQVWLLDRRGGEAVKATDFKAGVSDLAWSPDGKRLALVVSDVDPEEDGSGEGEPEAPRPLVVRRLQFKRDGAGFLRDLREHVYVFDLETKESVQVTSGPWDDAEPAWSPDGRLLAFVSNRTPEPDANDNTDLFVVAPRAGEAPRAADAAAHPRRAGRASTRPPFSWSGRCSPRHGYAVVGANPRGSSGPGPRFQPRHLGGLGQQGLRGRDGGRRSRRGHGRGRPGSPRRRRLEASPPAPLLPRPPISPRRGVTPSQGSAESRHQRPRYVPPLPGDGGA
jgi:hypothetical protein